MQYTAALMQGLNVARLLLEWPVKVRGGLLGPNHGLFTAKPSSHHVHVTLAAHSVVSHHGCNHKCTIGLT